MIENDVVVMVFFCFFFAKGESKFIQDSSIQNQVRECAE